MKLIERSKVLLPNLDSKGRPTCLTNPDDTYCEIVPNYPNKTLKQEIEFSPIEFLEIFGNKIDGRKSYIDDDLSEVRVCRRIPKVIYPQMAKNQANQWIYVVNEVEYIQAVVAEICESDGKSCAYLDQNLPPGMYSRCRQKYSYKRLLALHPTEKRTYSDKFKFPSCCACYVKTNDLLSRSIKTSRRKRL
ncbi:protein spaetzle 5-like [Oppia nitens]|uniref:protein spaetzle 5-like n=1 Tax=Oppia nitens TaxID=1686743 RepID=UPI0023DA88F8|nr:protein spaetzle 5-like [Oppia nitens]